MKNEINFLQLKDFTEVILHKLYIHRDLNSDENLQLSESL